MSERSRLRREAKVLSRYAGRGLLLALPEGTGFEWLSPSAMVVWEALSEPRSHDDLIDAVAELVGEAPDTVRDGTTTLIARLRARGLVVDAIDAQLDNALP